MLQDFLSLLCFRIPALCSAVIFWEGYKNTKRAILGGPMNAYNPLTFCIKKP